MATPRTMTTILGPNGKPFRSVRSHQRGITQSYDSARTTTENRRYYANADGLDARAANSAWVRQILRNRARYERDNNSYLNGIVQTLANHTIGTGPKLQMLTGDRDLDRTIEREFRPWSQAIALASKLRIGRMAKCIDGETFGLLTSNDRLPTTVKLDLKLVEADQVATPDLSIETRNAVDGIVFDGFGNPDRYHLLDDHPGSTNPVGSQSYRSVAARFVVHWFRPERCGQVRGTPEITSALYDFGELRRWNKAVLAAAETAADYAAILYSDAPALPDDDDDGAIPGETFDIERRVMTTLPAGWKMGQFEAQQPVSTHAEFERVGVRRLVRCLGMPLNIALGDSSGYNYSSGRLDHQTYFQSIDVEQSEVERIILDPLFVAWLDELSMQTDLLPGGADRLEGWPHRWIWNGREHVDPAKEATAQETRLRGGMTSFSEECFRQGVDPDDRAQEIADDIARFARLGITYNPFASTTKGGGDADSEDEDEPAGNADARRA